MDRQEALRRLAEARVGRLATADAAGHAHVVPFAFVLDGETVYWAVDRKPKQSQRLKRLDNIRANPNVQIVVDHYDEDWRRLWWVRATGTARILGDGRDGKVVRALELLAMKYPQYRADPPAGPVVAIELTRVRAWEASG